MKDHSTRYFAAFKKFNEKIPKVNLCIRNKDNKITASKDQQIKILSKYFQKMFSSEKAINDLITYAPKEMKLTSRKEEVSWTAKKIKPQRSPVPDELGSEVIKYAPIEIHHEIAKILNSIASKKYHVEELTLDLLQPLQKPEKCKGRPENLRPVTLPSLLRKLLTICIKERTWNRLKNYKSVDQASY